MTTLPVCCHLSAIIGGNKEDKSWHASTILTLFFAASIGISSATSALADGALEWQTDGQFVKLGFSAHDRPRGLASAPGGDEFADEERPQRRRAASPGRSRSSKKTAGKGAKGPQVASLGRSFEYEPVQPPPITGRGFVNWVAGAGCLASNLQGVIAHIAQSYGPVRVTSTCRSPAHNRRVGGAPRSYHLTGDAADLRVSGNVGSVMAYLRGAVGGLIHYGGGLFHIDNGPRRAMGRYARTRTRKRA